MKPREIRQMSQSEIEQMIADKEEELANLRLRVATAQLEVDNPLLLRQIRRDVAQLRTVLREHALGIHTLPGGGESTPEPEEQKET